ncbi:MAG: carbohydrate-binding domain-containing protein [Gemmatimonadaceae bacterium]|nr:carbohydrate-binding domain-containing protein [Gemmatimonadaceae bacterium]
MLHTLKYSAVLAAVALAAACGGSDAVTGSDDDSSGTNNSSSSVAVSALSCSESGVNANPFTVARALASYAGHHELASDYTWNSADEATITLNGTSATTNSTAVTISGTTVTVKAQGTYRVSGTLADGQLLVTSKDTGVVRLILDGAAISNSGDAPLFVTKAAKAVIILADNSVNTLTDGTTYPANADQNAALFSKANLSIGGNGALVVNARFNDGITGKDGLVINSGKITVTSVDDAVRGKDYLIVRNGTFTLTAGGDGLKSDQEDDATLGYVLVNNGTFGVTSTGDGIQAQTAALVTGGTFTFKNGGGSNVVIADSLSAKGVKGDSLVVIDGGTITIDAADDGLHTNRSMVVNGGSVTIATGDDGVHADLDLTINGGNINVTRSYEGVENSLADMVINGGTIRVVSSDDGVNLAGAGDTQPGGVGGGASAYTLRINGGRITVFASGDGIDANGSIVMSGGCAIVHGPTSNNNAPVDYDGSFQMTGGFLVAAGSSGMAQAPGTSSTQAAVLLTLGTTRAAGTVVHIQSSTGESVLDFAPSKAFQSIALSTPKLATGKSYSLYFGGTESGTATDGSYESGTYTPPSSTASTFTLSSIVSRLTF